MAKKPPKGSSDWSDDAARRRRPPATIDLSATEVNVEGVKPGEPPTPESEPVENEAGSHDHVPVVVEPIGPAAFYEKPDEPGEQTVMPPDGGQAPPKEPPRFDPPPFRESETPRPEFQPAPSARFPFVIAVAAACGGALALFLALFFGGMIPARDTGQSSDINTAELTSRLARLESQTPARRDAQAADAKAADAKALNDIGARIGKIESALATPPAPSTDPALAARLSAIEVAVKSLGDNASGITSRSSETADNAREARERSEATAKALADVKAAVDALRGNAIAKTDLDKVTDRVTAVESSTRTVAQKIETPGSTAADRDVRIAVLASSLKATVERGAPYATELAAIKPLIGDPKLLPSLEVFASNGVPSAAAMSSELMSLMPSLHVAATPTTTSGGILDRLQASAGRLVKVRPLDEAPGSDPMSVLDRAEAKSMRGDIAGTTRELSSLPANVRALSDAWVARAQARSTALAAVQQISAEALNALAKPAR